MKKIAIFSLAVFMFNISTINFTEKNLRDRNVLCELEYNIQQVNI